MLNNLFFINEDISNACCDVIVNASNGVGYMGGKWSLKKERRGIAESLNYKTKGLIEKEALINARRISFVPSWMCGTRKGDYFVTEPYVLNCKKVFHAVTMNKPASRSNIKIVTKLLKYLPLWMIDNEYKSVALPLLGCGNGNVNKNLVIEVIKEVANEFPEIKFFVYVR